MPAPIHQSDSNPRIYRFYEQLGFRCVGSFAVAEGNRQQFGDDDCFVYRLNREDCHPENAE